MVSFMRPFPFKGEFNLIGRGSANRFDGRSVRTGDRALAATRLGHQVFLMKHTSFAIKGISDALSASHRSNIGPDTIS